MTFDMAYVGQELDLFATAANWNRYLADLARPHIRGRVLEVGAGLGGKAAYLVNETVVDWRALEPDATLAAAYERRRESGEVPAVCRIETGVLADLPREPSSDCILYLDVIEHIEDDAGELAEAALRLAPGGALVVLVPAHQFLFSPFDAAIGHWRRYDRKMLLAAGPSSLRLASCRYLDSAGFFASLANRLVLRASKPTQRQIDVWDTALVPVSRRLDPLLAYRFGKSLMAVWTKADGEPA